LLFIAVLFTVTTSYAQLLTWTPQFPNDNSTITITVDATQGNQGLNGYTGSVYLHWGVITNLSTSSSDWRYVNTVWGTTTAPMATSLGNNKWRIILTNPRAYFGVPAGETMQAVALLFRDAAGDLVQKTSGGGNMYIPVYAAGNNAIQITTPALIPSLPLSNTLITTATVGQSVAFTAAASISGALTLTLNGTQFASATGTTISGNAIAVSGNNQVIAFLNSTASDTFNFYITPATVIQALPGGAVEGINYYGCTDSVTLVLYAPNKTSSMLIGDFAGSNWTSQSQYQMYKTPDGNYYWITIHGLTAGAQYAFQYLVDDSIYIADPYTELILDGNNDQYIPAATYPGLKAYPTNSNVSTGQNGLIGVLQTCAPQYNWKISNFTPPDKKNLIIEEVMTRDFATVDGYGNFQLLLDSLHYFKSLGINAIQLMPISEFSGNDSWGYNPNFYCALDKAYGTKAMYKTFIDSCHANGIAIIMDVVYNQIDDNNDQVPEARLYWDAVNNRPAANNPWLNPAAPHPYGVFDDLNHTSTATQYWVERSLSYWLTEYHVDGFRFDLAKGFTQNCTNGVNVECPGGNNSSNSSIENYDATRVQNIERYYTYVQSHHSSATMPYMILEFLGMQDAGNTGSEENAYANFGFMLWNDVNKAFPQNTEGYTSNADLSKAVYNSNEEDFSIPASDSYMNSHDDQRTMFNTETYGNGAAVKSISGIGGALNRQAAAVVLLFAIPGPHMFYEFDERGYDLTEGNGNTAYSPPHWEYLTTDANAGGRLALMNIYAKLISLRLANPNTFNNTTFSYDLYDNGGLFRRLQIGDPSVANLQVTVVANFDITAQTRTIAFQTMGNWYNYVSDGTGSGVNGATATTFNLASASQSITLQPGEYHVYIYQSATTYTFIGNGNWTTAANWMYNNIPPATLPSGSQILIAPQPAGQCVLNTTQTISSGASLTVIEGKNLLIPLNLTLQ
jgi:glycosidase